MQISSAMRGTEAATSVAEILAQFTIEPVDASHMPRDAIARNFKSLSAAVDAEMFAYPRRADESIEAYLQRMWFDQGSPQAVDRLITWEKPFVGHLEAEGLDVGQLCFDVPQTVFAVIALVHHGSRM